MPTNHCCVMMYHKAVIFSAIFVAVFYDRKVQAANCAAGWSYFAATNACYQVFASLSVNYTEAKTYCQNQLDGSDLTSISSLAEQQFIMGLGNAVIPPLTVLPLEVAWIGSQILVGGVWASPTNNTFVWDNGVPFNSYAGLWGALEPDDNILYAPECCTELIFYPFGITLTKGVLNDSPCGYQYQNIACMAPGPPTTTIATTTTTTPTTTTATTTTATTTIGIGTTTTVAPVTTITTTAVAATTTTTAAATTTTTADATTTTTAAATTTTTTAAATTTSTAAGATTTTTTKAAATTTTTTNAALTTTTTPSSGVTTTTTPTAISKCCPVCGVWSNWNLVKNCSDSCGSCGVQQYTRTCWSANSGCSCSGGPTTVYIPCNTQPCVYPRNSCCNPYKTMVVSKKNLCGPVKTLASIASPVCNA